MSVPLPLGALARHDAFANFWCARVATTMAYQMQAVAIGWQIYDITNSALDLGLVGLVQFMPTIAFSVFVGQAVDHFDRKRIARTCQTVAALVYGRHKHFINLFVWPSSSGSPPVGAKELSGYQIDSWTHGGLNFIAVSEIPASDLADFVHAYRAQAD